LTARNAARPRRGDAGVAGGIAAAARRDSVDDVRRTLGGDGGQGGQGGQWLALPARPLGVVVSAKPVPDAAAEQRRQGLGAVFLARRLAILCIDAVAVSADACEPGLPHDLVRAVDSLRGLQELASLPVGLFGIGPAAAATLLAAVAQRARLHAVVVCGGRLEPAYEGLPLLSLATLLIVGGEHEAGLASHRVALRLLRGITRLETIPGARACLSEPGCFETALHHSASWFAHHLARRD
jgi:hypothetical protein